MMDQLRAIIDRLGRQSTDGKAIAKVLVVAVLVSAGTVVVALGIIGVGSETVLAVDVTASDVSISTSNGNVTGVIVAPNVTFSWDNADAGVHKVTYRIWVGPSSSALEPTQPTALGCDTGGFFTCGIKSGSFDYTGTGSDITSDSDFHGPYDDDPAPYDTRLFNASEGSTVTTVVPIKIETRLHDSDGNVIKSANSTLTSFEVTVTNTEGEISTTGVINTSVRTPS